MIEFWENRTAVTNLTPAQTRIPEVPDQSDFLARWYEFHRGYRVITKEDGSEEHVAVLGEPFKDVSPGYLPRTLDELRAGRERDEVQERQHVVIEESRSAVGASLDDTLDQMFSAAEAEELATLRPPAEPRRDNEVSVRTDVQSLRSAGVRNREHQTRRIEALRRELMRMRSGIERVVAKLSELGAAVPQLSSATGPLTQLDRSLGAILGDGASVQQSMDGTPQTTRGAQTSDAGSVQGIAAIQRRLDEAWAREQEAAHARAVAAADLTVLEHDLDIARGAHEEGLETMQQAESTYIERDREVHQLQRELRTAENYTRIFGTREEMEQQGTDYESPIGGMFSRAWERFNAAEQTRQDERTLRQVLEEEDIAQRVRGIMEYEEINSTSVQPSDQSNRVRRDGRSSPRQELSTAMEDAQQASQGSAGENFPRDMLRAVVAAQDEEHEARVDFVARLVHQQAMHGTHDFETPPREGSNDVVNHLLRELPEVERNEIIQRMAETGSLQALQNLPTGPAFTGRTVYPAARNALGYPDEMIEEPSEEEFSDSDDEPQIPQGLDVEDDGRPAAKEEHELVFNMGCKVCYTQVADTACLPCGHLVLCQWCSEQHSPVLPHDRTKPRNPANCPVCRKRIKQKVRIYRA